MKRVLWMVAMVAVAAFFGTRSMAVDQKTVTGTSACAHCSGVVEGDCALMLVAKDGTNWVLTGDSDSYKAAMKVRSDGKKMTATLAGDPVTKKTKDGKEYKEVKVSDVKVEA